MTKSIYCSTCKTNTEHACVVDKQGEVVCTCSCGRFLKFPLMSKDEFVAAIERHESTAKQQITPEMEAEASQISIDELERMLG